MKIEGNYYSLSAAAAILGVTPVRLRQLAQQKRIIGAKKVGRNWIIPRPFKIIIDKLDKNRARKLKMKVV